MTFDLHDDINSVSIIFPNNPHKSNQQGKAMVNFSKLYVGVFLTYFMYRKKIPIWLSYLKYIVTFTLFVYIYYYISTQKSQNPEGISFGSRESIQETCDDILLTLKSRFKNQSPLDSLGSKQIKNQPVKEPRETKTTERIKTQGLRGQGLIGHFENECKNRTVNGIFDTTLKKHLKRNQTILEFNQESISTTIWMLQHHIRVFSITSSFEYFSKAKEIKVHGRFADWQLNRYMPTLNLGKFSIIFIQLESINLKESVKLFRPLLLPHGMIICKFKNDGIPLFSIESVDYSIELIKHQDRVFGAIVSAFVSID